KAVLLERLTEALGSPATAAATEDASQVGAAVTEGEPAQEVGEPTENGDADSGAAGDSGEGDRDAAANGNGAAGAGSSSTGNVGAAVVAAEAATEATAEGAAGGSGSGGLEAMDVQPQEEEEGADNDTGDLAAFVSSMEDGGEAAESAVAAGSGSTPTTEADPPLSAAAAEAAEAAAAAAAAVDSLIPTAGAAAAPEDSPEATGAPAAEAPTAEAAESTPASTPSAAAESTTSADVAKKTASQFSFVPAAIETPTARAPPASEDTYAYEEEQERLTMLKNLHQPMRKWFNKDGGAAMRERYGNFPMFWQDLASWPAMRELKKLYLMEVERGENPAPAAAPTADDAAASTDTAADAASTPASASATNSAAAGAASAHGAATGAGDAPAAAANGATEGAAATAEAGAAGEEGNKKKRKKRWGDVRKNRFASKNDDEAESAPPPNKRKSRWVSEGDAEAVSLPGAGVSKNIPGMPVNLTQEQIQENLVLHMRLQQANEKLATVEQDAIARSADPDRSPSPPPRYDANGVRTNNRNVRMRASLNRERTKVIEEMMKLNPMFKPPADFVKTKPHRKLYIPTDEYPGYNFIGKCTAADDVFCLIIGPRGNTQKRMERETDCKIAIRGKGSVKEGARRGPMAIDEDDELHVYVSGESEEAVEKAAKEVGKLLRPLDDEQNEHKQKQLRELALINGTLREEDYCNICGEKGHRQFECPKRAQTRSATVEVRCALCGDTSHPTRDCLLHKSKAQGQPGHEASLDKEYMSFMAELGDGDGGGGGGGATGAASAPQTGPRPTPTSSAAAGGGGGASGKGGFVSSGGPKANHFVWTPPTAPAAAPAATPASG
ncbi:unnamed protein product, partial [Ectocarpus sp. 12 AP-2014]